MSGPKGGSGAVHTGTVGATQRLDVVAGGAQTGLMRRMVLWVGFALLVAGGATPVGASAPISPPHFAPSGLVASSRHLEGPSPGASTTARSAPDADGFAPAATVTTSTLSGGSNVNVVAGADVTQ